MRRGSPPRQGDVQSGAVSQGYPIVLDVSRCKAVIVGGGPVAARKARGLLAAGAMHVRCVSPAFCSDMPGEVERVQSDFEPAHLDGFDLVFAATGDAAVNDRVVGEAHRRGALVNRADGDDDRPGDFVVPAVHRDGALMVAVSTAGAPALAARVRDAVARDLDPIHARMAQAMRELRPWVLGAGLSARKRHEVLLALASDEALAVLRGQGLEGLRRWATERFGELRKG
jgi:precorrin-2 dehydrogenase/sirohydrochlorin ferrochelatase